MALKTVKSKNRPKCKGYIEGKCLRINKGWFTLLKIIHHSSILPHSILEINWFWKCVHDKIMMIYCLQNILNSIKTSPTNGSGSWYCCIYKNRLFSFLSQQCSPASTPQRFSNTSGPSATRQVRSQQPTLARTQRWSPWRVRAWPSPSLPCASMVAMCTTQSLLLQRAPWPTHPR